MGVLVIACPDWGQRQTLAQDASRPSSLLQPCTEVLLQVLNPPQDAPLALVLVFLLQSSHSEDWLWKRLSFCDQEALPLSTGSRSAGCVEPNDRFQNRKGGLLVVSSNGGPRAKSRLRGSDSQRENSNYEDVKKKKLLIL